MFGRPSRLKAELQTGGAWIFVSHSHRDLEKVRRIRNELERLGHNPLLFFRKRTTRACPNSAAMKSKPEHLLFSATRALRDVQNG